EPAALDGEPERAIPVEDWRMRVPRGRVRHLVLGHLSRLRVEPADEPGEISRVPDVAVAICDEAMRSVAAGKRVLTYLPGIHIHAPEVVRDLTGVPEDVR